MNLKMMSAKWWPLCATMCYCFICSHCVVKNLPYPNRLPLTFISMVYRRNQNILGEHWFAKINSAWEALISSLELRLPSYCTELTTPKRLPLSSILMCYRRSQTGHFYGKIYNFYQKPSIPFCIRHILTLYISNCVDEIQKYV